MRADVTPLPDAVGKVRHEGGVKQAGTLLKKAGCWLVKLEYLTLVFSKTRQREQTLNLI